MTRHPSGAPIIALTGNANGASIARDHRVLITFTHEKTNAVAFAVAVTDG